MKLRTLVTLEKITKYTFYLAGVAFLGAVILNIWGISK